MAAFDISDLARLVLKEEPYLVFTLLEVGARPLSGNREPFYCLPELFPGSRVIAFEVDEGLCQKLNAEAPHGVHYVSVALGRENRTQLFYETVHPMCSSLYQPDELLMRSYQNLDVAMLKRVSTVAVNSLDCFMEQHGVGDADFIKIDVQGAELDVFQGGSMTLQQVLWVVSEVEFVPLYVDQPLFGDVCSYLASKELMFHKFLGLSGRALKPVVVEHDQNAAVQQLWADAVFMRNVFKLYELSFEKLLKMGVLAFLYGSPDVTMQCFKRYDAGRGRSLHQEFFELLQPPAS